MKSRQRSRYQCSAVQRDTGSRQGSCRSSRQGRRFRCRTMAGLRIVRFDTVVQRDTRNRPDSSRSSRQRRSARSRNRSRTARSHSAGQKDTGNHRDTFRSSRQRRNFHYRNRSHTARPDTVVLWDTRSRQDSCCSSHRSRNGHPRTRSGRSTRHSRRGRRHGGCRYRTCRSTSRCRADSCRHTRYSTHSPVGRRDNPPHWKGCSARRRTSRPALRGHRRGTGRSRPAPGTRRVPRPCALSKSCSLAQSTHARTLRSHSCASWLPPKERRSARSSTSIGSSYNGIRLGGQVHFSHPHGPLLRATALSGVLLAWPVRIQRWRSCRTHTTDLLWLRLLGLVCVSRRPAPACSLRHS